ncbi:hypothetical protein AAH994_13540 [Weeksellaceae bacterium A-14]|uniref:hypothetical protein n=1 Tax=Daejeonia sp. YH14 TaxID=3439042 RepID=UPI0031E4C63C
MKIFYIFLMVTVSFSAPAQKNKKRMDISASAETRVSVVQALGNNSLAKNFGTFYGFGFGGQLMTPINWGISMDYNLLFSDVKFGRQNYYGNLGSSRLSETALSIVHRDQPGNYFYIEESAGFAILRLNSNITPGKEKYSEGKGGISAGLKGVYSIDREDHQQFVFGLRAQYYRSGVYNENREIRKFYSHAWLAGVFFGYRYKF